MRFLRTLSERKSRLVGVAHCRCFLPFAKGQKFEELLEIVERYADGGATTEDLQLIPERLGRYRIAKLSVEDTSRSAIDHLAWLPGCSPPMTGDEFEEHIRTGKSREWDVGEEVEHHTSRVHFLAVRATLAGMIFPEDVTAADKDRIQPYWVRANLMLASITRDVTGNPKQPVAFDPRWRSESAVALARTAYDTRNFTLLPILADALEEAGCDNADVLAHCRDPNGVHVRGCWVVDGVLGKE